jgi:hypothetical protein
MNHLLKALGASLVALATILGSAKSASEKSASPWLLVAQSPIIAKGTLRVPISAIEELRASSKRDYVNLEIENAELLKGSAPKTFAIRWSSEGRDYAPDLPLLKRLNGREVVVFTLRAGPTESRAIYLAGNTPEALAPSSEILIHNVRTEIERQKQLLVQFPKGIDEIPQSRIESVRRLIENMTVKGRAEAAFEEMLRLGQDIVPATIMLIDDRRDNCSLSPWSRPSSLQSRKAPLLAVANRDNLACTNRLKSAISRGYDDRCSTRFTHENLFVGLFLDGAWCIRVGFGAASRCRTSAT